MEVLQAVQETGVAIPRRASSPQDLYVMIPTTRVATIVNSLARLPSVELRWTPLAIQLNIAPVTPLLAQPMSRLPMERPAAMGFNAQVVLAHHEIFSVNRLSMGVQGPVTIPLAC